MCRAPELGCSLQGRSPLLSVIWAAQLCHRSCSLSMAAWQAVLPLSWQQEGEEAARFVPARVFLLRVGKSWVSWMNKFIQSGMKAAALQIWDLLLLNEPSGHSESFYPSSQNWLGWAEVHGWGVQINGFNFGPFLADSIPLRFTTWCGACMLHCGGLNHVVWTGLTFPVEKMVPRFSTEQWNALIAPRALG